MVLEESLTHPQQQLASSLVMMEWLVEELVCCYRSLPSVLEAPMAQSLVCSLQTSPLVLEVVMTQLLV